MAADESPKSRNQVKISVKAVTMPTNPKSFGPRSRANTIREPTCRRKLAPWAQSLARPPRIVFAFRSAVSERNVFVYGRQDEEKIRGLTGIGDRGGFVCKKSRCGATEIGRGAADVVPHHTEAAEI